MSNLKQQPLPDIVKPFYKKEGIKIKTYKSPESFQKVLVKFIARNQVLHLCTSKKDKPRATPLGYMSQGLTVFILSEGVKHDQTNLAQWGIKRNFIKHRGILTPVYNLVRMCSGFFP